MQDIGRFRARSDLGHARAFRDEIPRTTAHPQDDVVIPRQLKEPVERNRFDEAARVRRDRLAILGKRRGRFFGRRIVRLGLQLVRVKAVNIGTQIVRHAELYLLTDARSLVLFKLSDVMDALNWIKPQVLFVRLQDHRERRYREKVVTDFGGRFARFTRLYDAADDLRLGRVVLTPDREIARLWQNAPDSLAAWRRLRRFRCAGSCAGSGPTRAPTAWPSWPWSAWRRSGR